MTRKDNWTWGQKLLLIALVIILFLFGLNFLLSYMANRLVKSANVVGIDTKTNHLDLNLKIRVFPYFKLGFTNLEYSYKNKPVLKIEEASAHLSFFELFKKRVHIYNMTFKNGMINLTNLPQMTVQKERYHRESDHYEQGAADTIKQQKESPTSTFKTASERAFKLDHVQINNLDIIYAKSSTKPLHFEKITMEHNAADESFLMNLNGEFVGQTITGFAGIYPQKEKLLDFTLSLGKNVVSLALNDAHPMWEGNVRGLLSDPQMIKQLFQIAPEKLPQKLEAVFLIANNKITVSPIKISFPEATLSARFSQEASSPINIDINIPAALLTTLFDVPTASCPLPNLMTKLLKGLNTNIIFMIEANNPQTASAVKTSVFIDHVGIKFDNNALPSNFEQTLKACFDYQLEEEDSAVTYHFR
ncbi:protein involved in outer membrane biogenesis [Legionella oakridgensis ATCC 33761 = DSM 21215]|uniref:Protein involved in outer membrane biogenesis n=3 Tax=Legionella oakridgensis TaxID=29423 RepID=W0B6N7_9GAMM|nr:protein involved in outer membrane biogenesis [Legionella oakridgensis ATCC 33761 = DSM 21215]ETO93980.1 protein involved in outer membrane biogenesis [Legionella oakridgensis RV-2-2007]KTD39735.1 AsmA family protein [Legionella oakridgensis]STY16119.1 Uncharacterized protein involved in outer membrane biogenesis [Legionella longbeachae]